MQIAAAVGSGAKVIIFDEPTSSLGEREVQQLYALIDTLRTRGVTMVYISHRMPEIFRLCDMVTVLRDGKHVSTTTTASLDEGTLVQQMIGRRLEQYFPAHERHTPGDEVLRVEGLPVAATFATSPLRCARAKWWGSPVWLAPGDRNWRRRSLVSTGTPPAR